MKTSTSKDSWTPSGKRLRTQRSSSMQTSLEVCARLIETITAGSSLSLTTATISVSSLQSPQTRCHCPVITGAGTSLRCTCLYLFPIRDSTCLECKRWQRTMSSRTWLPSAAVTSPSHLGRPVAAVVMFQGLLYAQIPKTRQATHPLSQI